MSDKEIALNALAHLPETATLEEISEAIAILAAIRRGEEAVDAGRLVPHEVVKQRTASILR
jgi:predicted transcriptional regulator